MALVGIFEHFVEYLLLLGAAIPPIAGIYVVDFFVVRRRRYSPEALDRLSALNIPAFAAWFVAVAVGVFTTLRIFTLTGIPACDSLLIAAALYALIARRV